MARTLRPLDVFPITTRQLEVLRTADVTPGMKRVTLGGPGLAAHTAPNGFPVAAFRSDGADDEFKILLQHPDAEEVVGPTQADGVLDWPRNNPHMVMRTYTVRRWDPVRGEIDVDFVNHGVGPATRWAYHVQPGQSVQIAGPKMSMGHPEGVDWTLIAGDETALPAIGRWLEEWPEGARGAVFIEVAEDSHRQELPIPSGVEVSWLSRNGAEPGTTTLLFDAIRGVEWPGGTVFAWVAGEALTLTPIRRWLRSERALPKEQVEVTGYWRRQEVVLSHDDPTMPDLDATEDDAERLHELAEIAPGVALRIAATLGLPLAFRGDACTGAELSARTGADPIGMGKLLRYLAELGVVAHSAGERYRLTDFGRQLEDETVAEQLDLSGPVAHRELGGMLALLAAVATGTGNFARWFGSEYAAFETFDGSRLVRRVELEAEGAVYVAGALAAACSFPEDAHVVISGRAPGSLAEAIVQRHPHTRVEIVGAAAELDALRHLHGKDLGLRANDFPSGVHTVLIADAVRSLPDEAAVALLRAAAQSVRDGGQVLLFAQPLDPELAHDHTYEDDLIEFALHGGGLRTHREYIALFAAAGLPEPSRTTIGWGHTLYRAARH